VICAALLALGNSNAGEKTDKYKVFIRDIAASPGEVIVAFEIRGTAAAIRSVSNIPVGWHFIEDNDASWQTKLTANSLVGAASLRPEDLKRVEVVVNKNEFGGLRFRLSGSVVLTKDYIKQRKIVISQEDFVLTPVP
jgi:hypothetical protein